MIEIKSNDAELKFGEFVVVVSKLVNSNSNLFFSISGFLQCVI